MSTASVSASAKGFVHMICFFLAGYNAFVLSHEVVWTGILTTTTVVHMPKFLVSWALGFGSAVLFVEILPFLLAAGALLFVLSFLAAVVT